LQVEDGHHGDADVRVTADKSLPWALLRRPIRIEGSRKLLVAFRNCFPS
jgi:hypothetical protein